MYQDPHATGPAPAYSIESDEEDDLWDDPSNPLPTLQPPSSHAPGLAHPEASLSWSDGAVDQPSAVRLVWVLIGEAGAYAAGGGLMGRPDSLSGPVYLLDTGHRGARSTLRWAALLFAPVADGVLDAYVVVPSSTPVGLQAAAAKCIFSRVRPRACRIVAEYSATGFFPRPRGQPPVRWLSSSEDYAADGVLASLSQNDSALETWDVPNLIKGVEAATMLESSRRQLPTTILLLPSQTPSSSTKLSGSAPGDGLYDHSPSSATAFPCLIAPDRGVLIPRVFDALVGTQIGWSKARAESGRGWGTLAGLGEPVRHSVSASEADSGSMYL